MEGKRKKVGGLVVWPAVRRVAVGEEGRRQHEFASGKMDTWLAVAWVGDRGEGLFGVGLIL